MRKHLQYVSPALVNGSSTLQHVHSAKSPPVTKVLAIHAIVPEICNVIKLCNLYPATDSNFYLSGGYI